MIGKKHILLLLTTALLPLAGCVKDPGPVDGPGLPMQLEASLAGDTKGGLTAADLTEFYLQLHCDDTFYSYFGKVTGSGSEWAATKQLFWKDKTTPVSCSAAVFGDYAFTEDDFRDGVELAVPKDQSTESALKGADLLTMSTKTLKYKDTDNGALSVELSHGLSKVNFVLTLEAIYYALDISRGGNPVTQLKVMGVNRGFTFKPGTVTVKPDTRGNITAYAGDYTPSTSDHLTATATFEAILVPQTFAVGELRVSFTLVDVEFTWTNPSAITLEPGKTYNLPLSVGIPKSTK